MPGRVAIGLGSNLGDRLSHLRVAANALATILIEPHWSRVYETEPLHLVEQPPFLNACVTGLTHSEPLDLLAALGTIERASGRLPGGERYGPREIDLDILLYDDLEVRSPQLTIPHPRLHERAFALIPLAELAPNWQHTGLGRSIGDLAGTVSVDGITLTPHRLGPRGPDDGDGKGAGR